MAEVSLNELGREAAQHYEIHKISTETLSKSQDLVDIAERDHWQMYFRTDTQDGAREEARLHVEQLQRSDDERTARAKGFYQANAGRLFELAVIEAHMAGITIQVKKEVSLGQKV